MERKPEAYKVEFKPSDSMKGSFFQASPPSKVLSSVEGSENTFGFSGDREAYTHTRKAFKVKDIDQRFPPTIGGAQVRASPALKDIKIPVKHVWWGSIVYGTLVVDGRWLKLSEGEFILHYLSFNQIAGRIWGRGSYSGTFYSGRRKYASEIDSRVDG